LTSQGIDKFNQCAIIITYVFTLLLLTLQVEKVYLLLALVAATLFSVWPFVMKRSHLSTPWQGLFLPLGMILISGPAALLSKAPIIDPSWAGKITLPCAITLALAAGIINGGSMTFAYSKLIAAPNASRYLIIVSVTMPIILALMGWLFLKEQLSFKQICGIGVGICAIYLLN